MISSTEHSPTLLEGFPLYWVSKVEFKKPRGLETMAPYERELCGLLMSLGAKFGSSTLIKHEFDAEALKKYIGLNSPLFFNLASLCIHLSHLRVSYTSLHILFHLLIICELTP